MADEKALSRRERQIMDVLFARGEASVLEIQGELPNAPTVMAIRRMLSILEEKGFLRRRKRGREFIYMPKQSKSRAGRSALQHVLDTFFDGSVGQALATHLSRRNWKLSREERRQLQAIIDKARKEGK